MFISVVYEHLLIYTGLVLQNRSSERHKARLTESYNGEIHTLTVAPKLLAKQGLFQPPPFTGRALIAL